MCAGQVTQQPSNLHESITKAQRHAGREESCQRLDSCPGNESPAAIPGEGRPVQRGFATAGPGDHTQAAENHTGRELLSFGEDRSSSSDPPAQQGVGLHNPILMPNPPLA